MAKKFQELKLKAFLSELGSKKGVPGGGAAAALTGAIGCALIEMVSRINEERSKRNTVNPTRALSYKIELQELIERDAEVFKNIQNMYKQEKTKTILWQTTLKKGASIPLQISKICSEASDLIAKEKPRTSRWLESDLKEAGILLRAAFDAAVLTVEINLKSISDETFCIQTRNKIDQWRRKLQKY